MSKHKHHIIPRYRCKELGIDPDFDENIVEVDRLDHARIHWGYKCDDLEPLFEYITPAQWIIDLIPRGDNRDVGAAVLNARGELDGIEQVRGEEHPNYGRKRPDVAGKNNPNYKDGLLFDYKNGKGTITRDAYDRAYYVKNKEKIRDYYDNNKEKILEYHREYYVKNKEKIIERVRERKSHLTLERKAYMKEYRAKNKEKTSAYHREYYARKKAETQGEGTLKAFLR